MVIGRIQNQKQEHNLEWSYVGFRTAIPTLVFNFIQLFFYACFIILCKPKFLSESVLNILGI